MNADKNVVKDNVFMQRCLELAANGMGKVSPNPMVGAVIVYEGEVIGEGYHKQWGKAHAEVNAIQSVRYPELFRGSTLYVNLEPCVHTGKTPPCTDLILEKRIPRVILGSSDPNPLVAGKGIRKLKENGVIVKSGILEEECRELNRRFFTYHIHKRPYIILKWAQTRDGFIDTLREPDESIGVNWISNSLSQMLVHKWRSEEQAILIGTNTVITDNPQLTVRHWEGTNPIRIILDRKLRVPSTAAVFSNAAPTWVMNGVKSEKVNSTEWIETRINEKNLQPVLTYLYNREIQSLIVEGGKELLEYFINNEFWDEARVFIGNKSFGKGVQAPVISGEKRHDLNILSDTLLIFRW